jgi:hypothetical protein
MKMTIHDIGGESRITFHFLVIRIVVYIDRLESKSQVVIEPFVHIVKAAFLDGANCGQLRIGNGVVGGGWFQRVDRRLIQLLSAIVQSFL